MHDTIIFEIKKNKKYASIANSLIEKEIEKYFALHPSLKNQPLKKSQIKIIIKNVRAQLHRIYASYQTKKKKNKEDYFQELQIAVEKNDEQQIRTITKKMLAIAISTKERTSDYETIYKNIFAETGKPTTVIDLGAGLNPLSFPFMQLHSSYYYAYDIDENDKALLNKYFAIMKKQNLQGKADIFDLTEKDSIKNLPQADIIFAFKLFDLLDTKKKKFSEEIITEIFKKNKTKFIVASFATKTLSNKPMNLPRRIGFEKMLQRNKFTFQSFSTDNEIFYVISER